MGLIAQGKLCECGCGQSAPIPLITNQQLGRIAGEPLRFVHGHNSRRWHPQLRHGHARKGKRSAEYNSYRAAKARCENPHNNRYALYGARGIEFRFANFEDFLKELGPRPAPGYSLDRRDADGHYESGNVRWATKSEQQRNKKIFVMPRRSLRTGRFLKSNERRA